MADATPFQFRDASVPKAYEEYLVPRLFAPWARVLLDSLLLATGESVLDVACGPGVVTRMAAERVGTRGRVTGADISAPMLEIARRKPTRPGAAPIDYVESPAAPLAVPDRVYDVATCQQGFQFFPDRPAAVAEMKRALKPGGRVGIAVWGPISECGHFSILHAALVANVPRELADLMLLPFAWPNPVDLEQLLVETGFKEVRIDEWELPLTFEEGPSQAAASVMATPLAPGLAELPEAKREALRRDLESRFALYTRDGATHSKMSANIATARM